MHIRYNDTADLWQYLVSTGPEVWATLPIDAAQILSGTFADGRLSSNIPLKNAANTFSATGNIFSEILRADKGIKFPATQVASSDVNTLDDYEEGSFTPVVGGSTSETGQTYGVQVGRYVKIGKLVQIGGYVALSNKGTITGSLVLKGLPFAVLNVTNYLPNNAFGYFRITSGYHAIGLQLQSGATHGTFLGMTTGSSFALTTADISNTSDFEFAQTYLADA